MAKQVVSFHYTLKNKEGRTIDSSTGKGPLAFLEGSGQIIPGLEKTLTTLPKGEKKDVTVPYAEGYGAYDQKLIYQVPKEKFPQGELKVGDMFEIGEDEKFRVVTIIEVKDDEVVLDANHPLAGQDLFFHIEIVDRRDATAEELAHGHAHGAGGHHH